MVGGIRYITHQPPYILIDCRVGINEPPRHIQKEFYRLSYNGELFVYDHKEKVWAHISNEDLPDRVELVQEAIHAIITPRSSTPQRGGGGVSGG